MSVYESFSFANRDVKIAKLIGFEKSMQITGNLYAYLDFGGITGTSADNLAYGMLELARQNGQLQEGQTVLEATGAAFAVSLAAACARLGHQLYLVMPTDTPTKRKEAVKQFGAKVALCSDGAVGAAKMAKQAQAQLNAYYVNYFENDLNCEYHRKITGPALMTNIGEMDAIVVGVGSGGTVSGVGEAVKAWQPNVKIVAVEPFESQALAGGIIGHHTITGIGSGFVPQNYNKYIVDKVIAVPSQTAIETAKLVQITDGVPAGAASGAVLYAAQGIMLKNPEYKKVACVFCTSTFLG